MKAMLIATVVVLSSLGTTPVYSKSGVSVADGMSDVVVERRTCRRSRRGC